MSKYPVAVVYLDISGLTLVQYSSSLHHLPSGRYDDLCCLGRRHDIRLGRTYTAANLDACNVYADISIEVEASRDGLFAPDGDGDWLCTAVTTIRSW